MTSPARATLVLGAASAVSVAAGVVVAKVVAVAIGTSGLGAYSLFQSAASLGTLIFGLGMGTVVVRLAGPSAEPTSLAAARAASLVIASVGGAMGIATTVVVALLLGSAAGWLSPASALLLGVAVASQSLTAVEIGAMAAAGRVGTVSRTTAAIAIAGAAVLAAAVVVWGEDGLPAGIAGAGLAAAVIASYARSRAGVAAGWSDRGIIGATVRRALGLAVPFTASQVAGTGAALLIPAIVLWLAGQDAVGLVRAATTIGVGYLSVLVAGLAKDYFPRASNASGDRSELHSLMEAQGSVLMGLGVPLIVTISALAPTLVVILYSSAFAPAAPVLEWMLIGDVLKLLSWTLSYMVLARAPMRRFLALEAAGGIVLLLASTLMVARYGPVGAGMAYALTYAIYLAMSWVACGAVVNPTMSGQVRLGLAVAGTLTAFQIVRPSLPPELSTGLLLAVASVAGFGSWRWWSTSGAT